MSIKETFTSRWTLIISVIGIAVGTGNIWRFSRIVAQNGGGSFLIPWIIFLVIWSVPLIIAEFAIGKYSRKGPIGAVIKMAGEKYAWMGGFIVVVATAIMFYYSVVTGWCIKYFTAVFTDDLLSVTNYPEYWTDFSTSFQPILFHASAIFFSAFVVYRGIVNGIEKASKLLVPSLLIILVLLGVRAVTLPNAFAGIEYFFKPDFQLLLNHKIWIQALTQNAWDTGAGWGLILTYAIYTKQKEDLSLNGALIGFGNNSISLLAGIIIFSTVFALTTGDAFRDISISGPANTGLTFIYLPELFNHMPGGYLIRLIVTAMFFLALSSAALTSLISLVELTTRALIDFGLPRERSIIFVAIAAFLLGLPSSFNLEFLINQDWVWGVGLILSGGFISFTIIKFGVNRFREEIINGEGSDYKIGKWYNFIIAFIIPVLAIVLLLWWIVSSYSWEAEWWNPLKIESAGTAILQWMIVLFLLIIFNKKIVARIEK